MPMNCDQAIEFLPWLLNGSLEATERDEVERHLATCERCRAALKDTQDAWTIFCQHIPSDALVALAYGEVPEGIDPAVAERHLATCPECAVALELARTSRRLEPLKRDDKILDFREARSRQEPVADRGSRTWRAAALAAGLAGLIAGAGWIHEFQQAGSLAERLARKPAAVQETRPAAPPPPIGGSGQSSSQEVATLKSELQTSQQNQEKLARDLDEVTSKMASLEKSAGAFLQPQVNAWSGTVSSEVVRDAGGSPEANEQVLPGNRLALPVLSAESANALRDVEILDGRGTVFWKKSGLLSTKDQEYTIGIPPGFLKPGRYTIQLYSNQNGKRVKRESYKIRVE
jgi:anti-sigma factor RsiW